jgi:glycosyltransferase involved in cell wall biosynthesis
MPWSVAYVFPISHAFRVPFHIRLRALLSERGIDYQYVYSNADTGRGDTQPVEWATLVPMHEFKVGKTRLRYQRSFLATWRSDLVIVQQESALVANYLIIATRRLFGRKVAFFGHGKNYQSRNAKSLRERLKRHWLKKVDWWFCYTDGSAKIVMEAGFPADRITVVNNAIDTTAIVRELAQLDADRTAALRHSLAGGSQNVGVFVGGLYPEKRIPFLLNAARLVRLKVPNFQLIVIGGGSDSSLVKEAAAALPWIHYVGPRFGKEKSELICLARVLLMPGLVGLSVLDSFVYGVPMVTTNLPYHSPEIDYLRHDENGVVVDDADNASAYADAVVAVLQDSEYHRHLKDGGASALETYTIENMSRHFANGIAQALERPPRR